MQSWYYEQQLEQENGHIYNGKVGYFGDENCFLHFFTRAEFEKMEKARLAVWRLFEGVQYVQSSAKLFHHRKASSEVREGANRFYGTFFVAEQFVHKIAVEKGQNVPSDGHIDAPRYGTGKDNTLLGRMRIYCTSSYEVLNRFRTVPGVKKVQNTGEFHRKSHKVVAQRTQRRK